MSRRKSVIFQIAICVFICSIVFLAAVLNAYSFINSSVEAVGENRAVILSQIKGRIEYGLKYGRQLDNYYDIEEIFDKVDKNTQAEYVYITDADGHLLYGENPPKELSDKTAPLAMKKSEKTDQANDTDATDDVERIIWTDGKLEHIVLPIYGAQDIEGYIGIACHTDSMKAFSKPYVQQMYLYALFEALAGIVFFELLFHIVSHKFREKKLKYLIMTTVIAVCLVSVLPSYHILDTSYEALSNDVAQGMLRQSADDIERLLDAGVYYSDMEDTDEYFAGIAGSSEQIASIVLTDRADEGDVICNLPRDGEGEEHYLAAGLSHGYIRGRVRTALINTFVTAITAIMVSIEILMFLLGLLIGELRQRREKQYNPQRKTIENLGLVRGIAFFFSSFRFMSVAFMSIVLAQIYKPVYLFGHLIPREILMSFPLSGQVFVSMITSYLSGIVIHKKGWKKTTLAGVICMMFGTLASAFAKEPIPFIVAQMVVGMGLGFAKMGIDIYAVAVSSKEDMSAYTSGENAGIIVGFSCSAALGALIASIFGYSGAYLVMTLVGLVVFFLILFFGMNVVSIEEKEEKTDAAVKERSGGVDLRFPAYILLVIIPYFFIMMFVDYFFPVYANSAGITTDAIGYVMLVYGLLTAYIGTPLCPVLSKKMSPSLLMPVILLILAGSLFAFAIHNFVIVAAAIVALIGIVDGIMPSIQFMYVYDLPISRKMGFSKVLGIEGFFSSMIGAVAPVIFGVVMLYGKGGLALVAALIAVCAVIFMFLNRGIKIKGNKKKITTISVCVLLAVSLFVHNMVYAVDDSDNKDRGRLKIGYCQAGGYYEFDYQLYQIGMALTETKEFASPKLSKLSQGAEAGVVWDALCMGESKYYEFDEDGFFDLASPEFASLSEEELSDKLRQLIEDEDIDIMFTMGTTAGIAIRDCGDVPYMNFIASNPVSSGITQGEEYSKDTRAWAHVNSGVEEKALAVMDDIFVPDKLGIVYNAENPEAYIYSGAASLDAYASEKGRKVVMEAVSDEFEDTEEAYENYKKEMLEAHKRLADSGIDVYILTTSYLELSDFEEVLSPFMEKGIPVFSINSTEDVRCGALAAVEMFDYQNIGRFAVDTLKQYRDGEELAALGQQYATSPFLVINIDTMRRTGIRLPLDTLISTSKIYGKYEGEE